MVQSYTKVLGFQVPYNVLNVRLVDDGMATRIEVPNLDAEESSTDLLKYAYQLKFISEQYRLLEVYAKAKAGAVYCRQNGMIARALALEAECDECYKLIDQRFKW